MQKNRNDVQILDNFVRVYWGFSFQEDQRNERDNLRELKYLYKMRDLQVIHRIPNFDIETIL